MLLLVLLPAGLHEEGIRGHLASRLVGVALSHGDRRRLPGGTEARGWAPAGLDFPPKPALARVAPPQPARQQPPGPAPPPNHPPPGRGGDAASAHTLLRGGGGSRREQSRPRLPPRATLRVPPGGRRRRRPLTGPGGGRERRRRPPDPFPTETSPGFHVASPTKSCRLATGSKSTKPGTGPGRVSRPLSTAPGPSPARNLDSARRGEPRGPGAQGGQRAEREGERQAHEPRRGRRGFLPGGRSSQRPSKQQAPAETLPSLGSGVNWFIAYPILRLLFCRLLRATAT